MANHIVLVPQKLLQNPPSVREGLSHEVEQQQRIYGCHLIQKAGILLKLEAVSIASAQTILHRFFFRRSLKQFDVRRVATASLLLACKLEEDPRRVMHLIGVIWLLSQLEDQPNVELKEETLDNFIIDFDSQEYELFRMDVFRCERYILRELGFMVSQTLVHPHRYILQYIHALFKDNFLFTNQLSQKAWGYLNDSMRTTLCCEVQPAVIAVGSIFLAACDLGIPLPRETGWYELFDVSWEDVMKVCSTILSLYTLPLPSYLKLAEETKLVQRASISNSGGAATSVRTAAASSSSSVSSKNRTTQVKEELASTLAVPDNVASRSEGLSDETTRGATTASSSSSSGRGHTSSGNNLPEKEESEAQRETSYISRAGGGTGLHIGKDSPVAARGVCTSDDIRGPAQGDHREATEYGTASEKQSGRHDVLGKSAARFPRAQPRAPPPLKERTHAPVRTPQRKGAVFGRASSPARGSSVPDSCRDDAGRSSGISSRSSTGSGSRGTGSCSSNSASISCSGGGEGLVAAPGGFPGRLKYIHFSSSGVGSSADRSSRAGYSGAAGGRHSPSGRGARESDQSSRRDSSPSAPLSRDRSFEREERPRGRADRSEAPCTGGNVSPRKLRTWREEVPGR